MAEIKDNPIINYAVAAAQSRASDTQAKVDIQKQLDIQEQSNVEAMLAATTVGNSQKVQVAAQESWKASSDAQIAAMGEALGVDWTNQASKTNRWAREMADNAEKAYAALDIIKEKQTKTLLNDPLGFIEAQFSLPADIATHNYYADKHNAAEENMNNIIGASSAAAVSIKQQEKRTSAESALAKAEEASALAAGNVAALKRQGAGDRIKGISELNNLTSHQADMVFKVHAAQNADASLALQRQAAADARANRMLALQDRQERIDLKKAGEAEQVSMMEARNLGAKAVGKAPITDVKMFLRENAMLGKDPSYQDMVGRGFELQVNGGNLTGVQVAKDAGAAARNYAQGGVSLVGNQVGSFLSATYTSEKAHPTAPKDPAAFAAYVNEVAVSKAIKMRGSIDNSDPASPNIYAAPPPAVILQAKRFSANPFIVDTVVPMVEVNKNVAIPDAVMLEKAVAYAKENKANFNVAAAGIVDYYTQASLSNSATRLYKEHGLPSQTSYIARIGNKNVNLTDITQVKQYIFKANFGTTSLGDNVMGIPSGVSALNYKE